MLTDKPATIMAMPSMVTVVRGALEECMNRLDAEPDVTAVEEAVALPYGRVATVRCRSSQSGVTVTIRVRRAPSTRTSDVGGFVK